MSENNNVTVWGKPFCSQCESTKSWLDSHGIEYKYRDITAPEHVSYLLDFKERGLLAAPIVVVEDWLGTTMWSGHDEDKLEIILED